MKSSKLMDMLKQGNIVVPLFFLQHYKDLKLELNEFIFLMYCYHLGNQVLFDPKRFSKDLNLDSKEVMILVSNLTEKKFLQVEVVKNEKGVMEEVVILDGFYEKLSFLVMEEVNHSSGKDSTIFEIIEKEFGRTLSPIEYEIVHAWLDHAISEELIKEAIKEATFNGVSNLRYIDKILYEWGKAGIKDVKGVEQRRKMRNQEKEDTEDVDLEMVDWDWFDEDE